MRRDTQRLYESIMKVVDRSVRKALNESKRKFDKDTFIDTTTHVYETWLNTCDELVDELIETDKIYDGMDFNDASILIEDDLQKKLNKAVGGDWWKIGKNAGLTDIELDYLWNDYMQSKNDCICDYIDDDDDDLIKL